MHSQTISAAPPQATADRLFELALYDGTKDVNPKRFTGHWTDEVERLTGGRIRTPCAPCPGKTCPHKQGAAFNYAELVRGTTRATKNVLRVHAAAFDVDHGDGSKLRVALRLMKRAGLDFVAVSTHSYSVKAPKVRVVIWLSRPVFVSEWPTLWPALNARFELHADESAKDPARLFFCPSAPEGAEVFTYVNRGRPLDVDEALKSAAPLAKALSPVRSGAEWLATIEAIGDGQRNSTLAALAGCLFRSNLAPQLAFGLLEAVNEARCKPPLPQVELRTIAASIAKKEAARRGLQ